MYLYSEHGKAIVNVAKVSGFLIEKSNDVNSNQTAWDIIADFGTKRTDRTYKIATFQRECEAKTFMYELALLIERNRNKNILIDVKPICNEIR